MKLCLIFEQNFKRVAEVWLDDYKQYIYKRNEARYNNISVGDISIPLKIREELQCQSFKWFLENVAFDMLKHYPLIDPPDFAWGVIRSLANPKYCIDRKHAKDYEAVGIAQCSLNTEEAKESQQWRLSWFRDIRWKYDVICLDLSVIHNVNSPVELVPCHGGQGNQHWEYVVEKKWLKTGVGEHCLDFDERNVKIFANKCDEDNDNMQWEWEFLNTSATFKVV